MKLFTPSRKNTMPQLPRSAPRLLRTVKGRPYATDNDHDVDFANSNKRPKLEEPEDLYADPMDSSSNEEDVSSRTTWASSTDTPATSSATSIESSARSSRESAIGFGSKRSWHSTREKKPPERKVGRTAPSRLGVDGTTDGSDPIFLEEAASARRKKRQNQKPQRLYGSKNFHVRETSTSKRTLEPIVKKENDFKPPPPLNAVETGAAKSGIGSKAPGFQKPSILKNEPDETAAEPSAVFRPNTRSTTLLSGKQLPTSEFKPAPALGNSMSGVSKLNADIRDQFKMPSMLQDDDQTSPSKDSTDPIIHSSQVDADAEDQALDDVSVDLSDDEYDNDSAVGDAATFQCPSCQAVVPESLLQSFQVGKFSHIDARKRMALSEQERFCRFHRRAAATETWKDRGYPDVDWHALPARVRSIVDTVRMRDIISCRTQSAFREALRDRLSSGKHRNLAQSLQTNGEEALSSLVPGYYGGRGAKVITEAIMKEHSDLLRDRVGKDKVISAAGVAGFVQAVLVPEVGVALIVNDLAVDRERATEVLHESAAIGEMVWEGDEDFGSESLTGGTQW